MRSEHGESLRNVEENITHYEILQNPEVRTELKERMSHLIDQVRERHVDALVFLDRSARPLSWLFREMWKKNFPDERVPDIKFLNIGSRSFVHSGAAKRLTSGYSKEPWHLEGDLMRKMQDFDFRNDWLNLSDVPDEWQSSVADNTDQLEELKDVYKHSFDDKRVLIVDDFIFSGRSELVAIASLSAIFEKGSFFGTALFHSTGEGIDIDRQKIPWLSIPGMSGVMELPESNLVSFKISQGGFDLIRQNLIQEQEPKIHVLLSRIENFEPTTNAAVQAIEDSLPISREKERMIKLLGILRQLLQQFKESRSLKGFDVDTFRRVYQEFTYLHRQFESRFTYAGFGTVFNNLYNMMPILSSDFRFAINIQKILDLDYPSLSILLERASTLRREMKELGSEDA